MITWLQQSIGTCQENKFERKERWYEHVPESVLENEEYKLLWDFSVQTDHEIGARIW